MLRHYKKNIQDTAKHKANYEELTNNLDAQKTRLEQELKVARENEEQLKKALDQNQKHVSAVETNSIEANNTLEAEIKNLETRLTASQKHTETLSSELTALRLDNQLAKQVITQTKEKLHKNYVTATFQNKKYETEIKSLHDNQEALESKVFNLESRKRDLKEREKAYHDAEYPIRKKFSGYCQSNFRDHQRLSKPKLKMRYLQPPRR